MGTTRRWPGFRGYPSPVALDRAPHLAFSGRSKAGIAVKQYELITIIDPARLDAGRKSLGELLQRYKFTVTNEEDWGEKRLPHELNKLNVGRYLFQNVKADPTRIAEFRHDLQIDSNILRCMLKRSA